MILLPGVDAKARENWEHVRRISPGSSWLIKGPYPDHRSVGGGGFCCRNIRRNE
ncbi:MAG: hypothetical protein JSU70_02195 [Phycisphaerales bacterium]|nr:MAG: hypothetical protein JSU70_02195 [Phycisphaerales bacterium]